MDINLYLRWGESYFFRSISVACAATNSQAYHPYRMDWRNRTHHLRKVVAAAQFFQGWPSPSIPRPSSASDAVALVLEGVIGKRHGNAHDGDVVIFSYICCLCRNKAGPYLLHGILMVQAMATVSGRRCCVSWHSRPASCATIMSPPPPS